METKFGVINVPEPEVKVFSSAAWLVPKAHADYISNIAEKSSHFSQAVGPDEGIKGIEVIIAAAPAWCFQVVI